MNIDAGVIQGEWLRIVAQMRAIASEHPDLGRATRADLATLRASASIKLRK